MPLHVNVGVAQAQIVDGGVGGAGEVALYIALDMRAQHVGALYGEAQAGGDAEQLQRGGGVEVVAVGIHLYGGGIEEHHVFAPRHHLTAVGIEMRIDEAMPRQMPRSLGGDTFARTVFGSG